MDDRRGDTLMRPSAEASELDPWDRTLQLLYASPAPVRRRPRPRPWVVWSASGLTLALVLMVLRLLTT